MLKLPRYYGNWEKVQSPLHKFGAQQFHCELMMYSTHSKTNKQTNK
jgi:hypothetical protein